MLRFEPNAGCQQQKLFAISSFASALSEARVELSLAGENEGQV